MADNTTLTATEFIELKFKDYKHKDLLLKRIKEQHYQNELHDAEISGKDFLESAMFWDKTEEGSEFWYKESLTI